MGKPLPGYEVVLLDSDGNPADDGEVSLRLGAARPTSLMVGYVDDPERTAAVMANGYYRTGDEATRDADGYIHFVGRGDDVFKSSDYRISPFELESVLVEHPLVAEAAVVRAPRIQAYPSARIHGLAKDDFREDPTRRASQSREDTGEYRRRIHARIAAEDRHRPHVRPSRPLVLASESEAMADMTDASETARSFERHARYINPAWIKVLDLLGYGRVFVRAEGSRMWDAEGRVYVDFLAGCGSVPLGYNHPEILLAAEASLRAFLPSFVQLAPPREAGLLAELLASRLPPELSRAHFVSSGSEAVDGALKLAFAATRRPGVLYCEKSYHGVSLGALSVMGSDRMRAPFPAVPERVRVPFGDLDAAEAKLKEGRFAAFIVEPIQFEGGVRLTEPRYFAALHALCRKHGTLLIFDEAQTGLGRTGTLFAFEPLGMVPDILCYAKALSGGLVPIGGYSTSPELQRRAYGSMQDCELVANTFGGGALACVVARRTLELIDEALLARVRAMGDYLRERLRALAASHAMVRDARGKGLLWAIECGSPTEGVLSVLTLGIPNLIARELFAFWVAQRMLERGFLTQVPAHDQNVLRIEPPLVVERSDIDAFVEALGETLVENESFLAFLRSAGGRLLQRQLGGGDAP